MTDEIIIRGDLPMPVRSAVPPLPLEHMEIGKYILVPATSKNERGTIRQRINRYQLAHPPTSFSMSVIDDENVRIFRMDDKT
jgi:hypothetical protein